MYYVISPFIYLISFLPFRAIYLLSDIMNFFLFRLFRYRRTVIRGNMERSFPEKSPAEIDAIEKEFHKYFCDLSLETIKTLSIRGSGVKKHVKFKCAELFNKYAEKDQSVIIVMGHYGNWELAGSSFAVECEHKLIVIYHPLKDRKFNELVVKMRTGLGNELYARNDVLRGMIRDRNRLTATAFIADQTPAPEGAYWTEFLNQDTPVFTGTAKIAKKFNYPVIYVSVDRPTRGHYTVEAEVLFENPADHVEDEISERHTKKLEEDIKRRPEIWLWSHKRWKHKRPAK